MSWPDDDDDTPLTYYDKLQRKLRMPPPLPKPYVPKIEPLPSTEIQPLADTWSQACLVKLKPPSYLLDFFRFEETAVYTRSTSSKIEPVIGSSLGGCGRLMCETTTVHETLYVERTRTYKRYWWESD